jgi:4-hydroxybenzoate polyprenyltransferase
MNEPEPTPLVVDLDGTLLGTDLLMEAATQVLVQNPLRIFALVFHLFQGKAALKTYLAGQWEPEPSHLPFHEEIVEWLRREKEQGRYLVLATASHRRSAQPIYDHLGMFDELLATDGSTNLRAGHKRDALISRFGEKGFDYVGDSRADLPVWQAARQAYIAGASPSVIGRVRATGISVRIVGKNRPNRIFSILQAMRPHQWIKNLLIPVPLLAAHHFTDPAGIRNTLLALLAFSLTASAAYLLNDLVDLPHDRCHPRKRVRPLASGQLSLLTGWVLWPILLSASLLMSAWLLPKAFFAALGTYFIVTTLYSRILKQAAILDVITLAGLYTLRIIAGAAATDIPLSFWLAAFSLFFFLSLAFVKRFSEIQSTEPGYPDQKIRGRGYTAGDRSIVSSLGIGAGYLSVLVLALYIQDSHTTALYATPTWIWPACPLLLYWISRVWILAHRGRMHDDPVVFAVKDPVSWVVGILFLGVFGLARFVP